MTFAQPLFLLAVLAALIPVLLHMYHRRTEKELPFSTLRFLRASVERTRRRRYIQDAVLMLLRCGALALVAVGLAAPTLRYFGQWLGGGSNFAIALVLDNSASMATRDQQGERWERARAAVERILDCLQPGDAVALLPASGPPMGTEARLYARHETVRQAMAGVEPSYERADLAAALKRARDLLADAKQPNKLICVVSDMQQVSWEEVEPPEDRSEDQAKLADPAIPIAAVDVRGTPLPNAGLRKLTVSSVAPVVDVPQYLTVEVVGDQQVALDRQLEVWIDGQRHGGTMTIEIPAGQSISRTIPVTLREPGVHRGYVQLVGDDACAKDDRLYFGLELRDRLAVAVVVQRHHPIAFLDDAFYVQRALEPVGDASWPIRPVPLLAESLASQPLASYRAICVANVAAPPASVLARLAAYVQGGGRLLWFCGDNVDPAEYEAANAAADQPLFGVHFLQAEEAATADQAWSVSWMSDEHPMLSGIVKPESVYRTVTIRQRVRVQPDPQLGGQVLAKFNDGAAWIVEKRIGRGTVWLITCAAQTQQGNLPLRPIFVPMINSFVLTEFGDDGVPYQLVAGTALSLPRAAGGAVPLEIVHPSGKRQQITPSDDDSQPIYRDTHQPGVYVIKLLDPAGPRSWACAVNHDPLELQPEYVDGEELAGRFGNDRFIAAGGVEGVADFMKRLREGKNLTDLFLLGVLLLLVAETFVANRRVPSAPAAGTGDATRLWQRVLRRRYLPESIRLPG